MPPTYPHPNIRRTREPVSDLARTQEARAPPRDLENNTKKDAISSIRARKERDLKEEKKKGGKEQARSSSLGLTS